MRFQISATILLALAMAGCADPSWTPDTCDQSGAHPSGNAPLLAAFTGTDAAIAQAVTQAFGDAWTGNVRDDSPGELAWTTRDGEIRISHTQSDLAPFTAPYSSPLAARFTREHMVATLQALGVDTGSVKVEGENGRGTIAQLVAGMQVAGTETSWLRGRDDGAYGWWSSFDIPAQRDLSHATAPFSKLIAKTEAAAFSRCVMDRAGRTEGAGYAQTNAETGALSVMQNSLSVEVVVSYTEPTESHCGYGSIVMVDVVTGAMLGTRPPSCA